MILVNIFLNFYQNYIHLLKNRLEELIVKILLFLKKKIIKNNFKFYGVLNKMIFFLLKFFKKYLNEIIKKYLFFV